MTQIYSYEMRFLFSLVTNDLILRTLKWFEKDINFETEMAISVFFTKAPVVKTSVDAVFSL